jgi:hypothetical protein
VPKAGSFMRFRQIGHGTVTHRFELDVRPKTLALTQEVSTKNQYFEIN